MSFNGNEGARITLAEGAEFTSRYRANHSNSIQGMFVGRDHLEALLAQADCKGIRMYLGENVEGGLEFVFVGANSNEEDMLDLIIERTVKCPPNCANANPLNSNLKG